MQKIEGFTQWLNEPEITNINRMPPRACFMSYQDADEALKADRYASSRTELLNGEWDFRFYESSSMSLPNLDTDRPDTKGWDKIRVPSCWATEGYGIAQYCNIQYPWEGNERVTPPEAPVEYNPVGIYVRKFRLDQKKAAGRVVLTFDGVEACFYLYINGVCCGYSESSFNTAEFDISSLVREGENTVAVRVHARCTGSWLEDQDFFRLGGIFRDVYLTFTEPVCINDFKVVTELDRAFKSGHLRVETEVAGDSAGCELELTVYDMNGDIVAFDSANCAEDGKTCLRTTVPFVNLWSAEKPYLYTTVLALRRENGESIEYVSSKTGFRSVELKGGIVLINGKKVTLRGVNRHEFSAESGRAITREDMLTDIRIMKRHNINAVRTSHYPDNPYWYELCDEYGLYVLSENNLETHGTQMPSSVFFPLLPASERVWETVCMDRIEALYQRDKNHACIIGWSLGNEAGCGDNFVRMSDRLRELDPTRFIHYENVSNDDETYRDVSDVYSTMYTSPEHLEENLQKYTDKPNMLCEFSHAMGNSCGGNEKYTALLDKYENFLGFFVWDFIDQALTVRDEKGEYLGYGGDFHEFLHDGNFCGDGLIFADRTLSPKIAEIKSLYQPVRIRDVDASHGVIEVENRHLFTNLNEYNLHWQQVRGGIVENSGDIDADIAPGETKTLRLEVSDGFKDEWYLNVFFELKAPCPWAKAGHTVAKKQFILNPLCLPQTELRKEKMKIRTEYGVIYIEGGDLEARLSRRTGRLYYLTFRGRQLLRSPVELSLWRALTDNDRGNHQAVRCGTWIHAAEHADFDIDLRKIRDGSDFVSVETEITVPTRPESRGRLIYTFTSEGVEIDFSFTPAASLPEVPEIGLRFDTENRYYRLDYLGRGPEENYIDRHAGADVGLYKCELDELFVPYLKPQENGNRTDVRNATLVGVHDSLTLEAKGSFELNISKYTPEETEEALHPCQLPESDKLCVRVLSRQMGVGGYDSWGAHTLEEYKNHSGKEYKLHFSLIPGIR